MRVGTYGDTELSDLVLTGPRLTLRPWEPADAAAVQAIMQDRSMHRFLALPDPYTAQDAQTFVSTVGHEGRAEGTGLGSAVVRRDTGELVGSAALRLPTGLRTVGDIGYWIAPAAQGQGFAAEVTDVLARWGFDLGLDRIELFCDVRNVASAGAALRAGFRFEGVNRVGTPSRDGLTHDLACFGRLAGDDGEPVPPAFPRLAAPLTDGVIAVRAFELADVQPSHEMECDPVSLATGFTGRAPDAEAWRKRCERAGLDRMVGGAFQFSIIDVSTGRYAGQIQLRKAGPPGAAAVGYTVHPEFRGRAYTTRALRLLSGWAFEVAGYARLELGAKWHNAASLKAAAAAGFRPEGTLAARLKEPDGGFSDECYFGLINPAIRRSAPV